MFSHYGQLRGAAGPERKERVLKGADSRQTAAVPQTGEQREDALGPDGLDRSHSGGAMKANPDWRPS